MTVISVDLLDKPQYEAVKDIIPELYDFWWLKTPDKKVPGHAYIVDCAGGLKLSQFNLRYGIRPVCTFKTTLSDLMFWQKSEKMIGSKFPYGYHSWTVLGIEGDEIVALCDQVITNYHFGYYRPFDPEHNTWEHSVLKQWLDVNGIELVGEEICPI